MVVIVVAVVVVVVAVVVVAADRFIVGRVLAYSPLLLVGRE